VDLVPSRQRRWSVDECLALVSELAPAVDFTARHGGTCRLVVAQGLFRSKGGGKPIPCDLVLGDASGGMRPLSIPGTPEQVKRELLSRLAPRPSGLLPRKTRRRTDREACCTPCCSALEDVGVQITTSRARFILSLFF